MLLNSLDQEKSLSTFLNESCQCLEVDNQKILNWHNEHYDDADLNALLADYSVLYAGTAVMLQEQTLHLMHQQIQAIEQVIHSPLYQEFLFEKDNSPLHLLQPETSGLFMGYDFHITSDGPKLIEINTNAGGLFLSDGLYRSMPSYPFCCGESLKIHTPLSVEFVRHIFESEWRAVKKEAPLRSIAIVDENPDLQFLKSEMYLVQKLLSQSGLSAYICDPEELEYLERGVFYKGHKIDLIYNRLTDFSLREGKHAALKNAFEEEQIVLSPAPRHHRLFANKINQALFTDEIFLRSIGTKENVIQSLKDIPKTHPITNQNKEDLWKARKSYFFKPKAGFGSKAVYRGAKISKARWQSVEPDEYIAQEYFPAPLRSHWMDGEKHSLKFDVRVNTWRGEVISHVARVYQGQATNFKTLGGGFAPVVVLKEQEGKACSA